MISFQATCWQFHKHEPWYILLSCLSKRKLTEVTKFWCCISLQNSYISASTINVYWKTDSDLEDSYVFNYHKFPVWKLYTRKKKFWNGFVYSFFVTFSFFSSNSVSGIAQKCVMREYVWWRLIDGEKRGVQVSLQVYKLSCAFYCLVSHKGAFVVLIKKEALQHSIPTWIWWA